MWYSNKVGEEIPLVREDDEFYWAREGGALDCLNIVRKTDAIVFEDAKNN